MSLPPGGTMSTNPAEGAAAPAPHKPLFGSCWGCRVLSGLALIGSGIWVYMGPRRVMKQGIPPNMWHITQMTFAICLASWGVVVITDPVGQNPKLKQNQK